MNTIYLNKDQIESIVDFMTTFKKDIIEITSDNSSGIGSVIQAALHGVEVHGERVKIVKVIADESSW